MKRYATSPLLLLTPTLSSTLKADPPSYWMWHGEFPWVYSHDESSWWYMKAGTDDLLSTVEQAYVAETAADVTDN